MKPLPIPWPGPHLPLNGKATLSPSGKVLGTTPSASERPVQLFVGFPLSDLRLLDLASRLIHLCASRLLPALGKVPPRTLSLLHQC